MSVAAQPVGDTTPSLPSLFRMGGFHELSHDSWKNMCIRIIYIYMYVYINVCVYVYACMYIYIYKQIYVYVSGARNLWLIKIPSGKQKRISRSAMPLQRHVVSSVRSGATVAADTLANIIALSLQDCSVLGLIRGTLQQAPWAFGVKPSHNSVQLVFDQLPMK